MTAENEREIYHKLEAMKEIRNKTITLERLKRSILNEVRSGDQEGRCLAQYKREMELLQQEKMSHVEELRQIHADINAMETVIKQTEESMSRKLSSAARLHEDYRPLKHEVDLLRRQCLGLERLPELHEEEGSPVTPDRFPAGSRAAAAPVPAGAGSFLAPAPRKPPPPPPAFRSALDRDFLTVSLRFGSVCFVALPTSRLDPPPLSPRRFRFYHFFHFLLYFIRKHANVSKLRRVLTSRPRRQQPPPMKSCLSCHQQIHRNAPICPLCKAKSRSRNPKKPKKK